MIAPWLIIALTLVTAIPDLVNHNCATEAIARASVGLLQTQRKVSWLDSW
ncbi:hypothetical protein LC586_34235 [Nostoc sp. CHAB 5714]|uniref:Uncharacterized protein n=1 Tax=Nostoc favosum CHAB5714 TaxID=2780399 RepID=A0ABS8IJS9_9NOSO|nr:hypothetical protein [Nostoc favosum CHAB5714]MCC5605727.1 hypothetical protein [Nostoc sp. CHAB 5834]